MSPDAAALPSHRIAAVQASWIALTTSPAVTRGATLPLLDGGDDDCEEQAIAAEYKRRLAGLRHLPRAARAAAFQAAKLWRQAALRVLRDKQAAARRARQLVRRWQIPPPA